MGKDNNLSDLSLFFNIKCNVLAGKEQTVVYKDTHMSGDENSNK